MIHCVLLQIHTCFLLSGMGAWSLLLVSLRTSIVSAEICFLYWLRDNTLCYALSKCLLFAFYFSGGEEKDPLVIFSAN